MIEELVSAETSVEEIHQVFEEQKAHQYVVARTQAKERRTKLRSILKAVYRYQEQITTALYQDFRKHPTETVLTEVFPTTSELKHAIRQTAAWMSPKRVGTPLTLLGSSSYIHSEPKGVTLIISPWNFPFLLTFGPLVGAIAAGNTVIIKPSEYSPHTSELMKRMIDELFPRSEVAVFTGGVETSKRLLDLPFNHIFFTGSPAVGKIVMKAAATHLSSVTLELGGKSPLIIHSSANLKMAAHRLVWAKYMNTGQLCVAPDYVLVQDSCKAQFILEFQKALQHLYGERPKDNDSFARIINRKNFDRLHGSLTQSINQGAVIRIGGQYDADENYIAPTLLDEVSLDMPVMQEEIFGPLLPMISFTSEDEAISIIRQREKPLCLYIYSQKKSFTNTILRETRAGTTCINHANVQFFNHHLPFGGSNHSGIGKGHGYYGFQAFSNQRAVLKQWFRWSPADIFRPPFVSWKQKLARWVVKWL